MLSGLLKNAYILNSWHFFRILKVLMGGTFYFLVLIRFFFRRFRNLCLFIIFRRRFKVLIQKIPSCTHASTSILHVDRDLIDSGISSDCDIGYTVKDVDMEEYCCCCCTDAKAGLCTVPLLLVAIKILFQQGDNRRLAVNAVVLVFRRANMLWMMRAVDKRHNRNSQCTLYQFAF